MRRLLFAVGDPPTEAETTYWVAEAVRVFLAAYGAPPARRPRGRPARLPPPSRSSRPRSAGRRRRRAGASQACRGRSPPGAARSGPPPASPRRRARRRRSCPAGAAAGSGGRGGGPAGRPARGAGLPPLRPVGREEDPHGFRPRDGTAGRLQPAKRVAGGLPQGPHAQARRQRRRDVRPARGAGLPPLRPVGREEDPHGFRHPVGRLGLGRRVADLLRGGAAARPHAAAGLSRRPGRRRPPAGDGFRPRGYRPSGP
jgi:hypothetical protein